MQGNKCIVLNWEFGTALAVVRSVTDAIYFLHMLLQVSSSSAHPDKVLHFVQYCPS
jgi:cyclic nucleotide gated channel